MLRSANGLPAMTNRYKNRAVATCGCALHVHVVHPQVNSEVFSAIVSGETGIDECNLQASIVI